MVLKMKCNIIIQSIAVMLLLGVTCFSSCGYFYGMISQQCSLFSKISLFFVVLMTSTLFIFIYESQNKQPNLYYTVIWTLIVLGGVESILGLQQIYSYKNLSNSVLVLTGSFCNSGPYSGYLAMIFPVCMNEYLALKNKKEKSKVEKFALYLSLIVMLLIVCVLPAGRSRSAWLSAILSAIWVWIVSSSKKIDLRIYWQLDKIRMIIIILICGVSVLLGTIFVFHMKENSAYGRLFMWKISCQTICSHPLIGSGINSFPSAYGKTQEAYFAQKHNITNEEFVAGSPEYSFNEYLQFGVEFGIPSLIVILLFIGFSFLRGSKQKRISACGGILSLLIFSFFSYPIHIPIFIITFCSLLFICIMGHSRNWLLLAILLTGLSGFYAHKYDNYKAIQEWTNDRIYYSFGSYKIAKEKYAKLYPKLQNIPLFLFEYGRCLYKLKQYKSSTYVLKKASILSCDPMILNILGKNCQETGRYSEAEYWYVRSTHLLPSRLYPYYLLAKLYSEKAFNNTEKAKRMAQIVLTKEPKVQSIAIQEMRQEMQHFLK